MCCEMSSIYALGCKKKEKRKREEQKREKAKEIVTLLLHSIIPKKRHLGEHWLQSFLPHTHTHTRVSENKAVRIISLFELLVTRDG